MLDTPKMSNVHPPYIHLKTSICMSDHTVVCATFDYLTEDRQDRLVG